MTLRILNDKQAHPPPRAPPPRQYAATGVIHSRRVLFAAAGCYSQPSGVIHCLRARRKRNHGAAIVGAERRLEAAPPPPPPPSSLDRADGACYPDCTDRDDDYC